MERPFSPQWKTQVIQSLDSEAEGVILYIHGLNNHPEVMGDLENDLSTLPFHQVRVALRGHRGNLNEMKNATFDQWQEDLREAFNTAADLHPNIYIVAFSLGATQVINYLLTGSDMTPQKMALFSPALAVHRRANFIKYLGFLGNRTLLPSFAPKDYRANSGTSIGAYRSLFQSIEKIQTLSFTELQKLNIPTLIMVDKNDELISQRGIQEFINQNELDQWTLTNLQSQGSYHHLIIDQKTLGPHQWAQLITNLKTHFTS